jgi:hypothetical protein
LNSAFTAGELKFGYSEDRVVATFDLTVAQSQTIDLTRYSGDTDFRVWASVAPAGTAGGSVSIITEWLPDKSKLDQTAPGFSSFGFTGSSITENSIELILRVNEAATIYWAVYPTADPEQSYTDIINGTGAEASSSIVSPGNTTHNPVASGLSAGTAYRLQAFAEDLAGNRSPVAVSTEFTTASGSGPQYTVKGSFGSNTPPAGWNIVNPGNQDVVSLLDDQGADQGTTVQMTEWPEQTNQNVAGGPNNPPSSVPDFPQATLYTAWFLSSGTRGFVFDIAQNKNVILKFMPWAEELSGTTEITIKYGSAQSTNQSVVHLDNTTPLVFDNGGAGYPVRSDGTIEVDITGSGAATRSICNAFILEVYNQ